MTNSVVAYLALGSNLGNPVEQLLSAKAAISAIPCVEIISTSSLYESPAWGSDEPQPDYVNAVVAIRTTMSAHDLWLATSHIEIAHGRTRFGARNRARTLDIDLLLYGAVELDSTDLILPHPRMHERDFVLMPLTEIAPDIVIPGRGNARDCLRRIAATRIRPLRHQSVWN
ncbi:MAG: 2-amino-4-hydroxy-6-hydroxymethyldihydropteridine diphosphokinase [Casimicrobium sp.]